MLLMLKGPEGAGWVRIPECDRCGSQHYYAGDLSWSKIALDSGWSINARTGAVKCDRCAML